VVFPFVSVQSNLVNRWGKAFSSKKVSGLFLGPSSVGAGWTPLVPLVSSYENKKFRGGPKKEAPVGRSEQGSFGSVGYGLGDRLRSKVAGCSGFSGSGKGIPRRRKRG